MDNEKEFQRIKDLAFNMTKEMPRYIDLSNNPLELAFQLALYRSELDNYIRQLRRLEGANSNGNG